MTDGDDEAAFERYRRSLKRSTWVGEAMVFTGIVLTAGFFYAVYLVADACRHAAWP